MIMAIGEITNSMFTGLIRAIGRLYPISGGLKVQWHYQMLNPLTLGDSVAVDGVCLTVKALCSDGFEADVSSETITRSNLLAKAQVGGLVNLEPALSLSDRLGGHLVSGHVDGLGMVRAIDQQSNSWRLELGWQEPAFDRYVCTKGSIAVNGISLTVAGPAAKGAFWVAVIPVSWQQTTLKYLKVGDLVNLEADLLAKYVEKLLTSPRADVCIDQKWLLENGWSA
jgi:riboflavin synthase